MDVDGGNAVVVPIGTPQDGFPTFTKEELAEKVLDYDSCLLITKAKLMSSRALAGAILAGTHQHLDTCRPTFRRWVVDMLYEHFGDLPDFVSEKLPPRAGATPKAPRRATAP